MRSLIFDLETDGLLDTVTKIHCIVTQCVETGEVQEYGPKNVEHALHILGQADLIIGHNIIKYDIPVIQKLYPDWKPHGKVRDTIVCTRLIWSDLKEQDFSKKVAGLSPAHYGRHSLKAWGSRLGCLKGTFGETADWKEFSPAMLEYCVQDVEVTCKLWEHIKAQNYSEKAIELEHQFAEVIAKQERHGFAFDKDAAVRLYSKLGKRRAELEAEIQKVFPGWDIEMKAAAGWVHEGRQLMFATKAEAKAAGWKAKDINLLVKTGPRIKHIAFNPSSHDHIARALTEKHGWKPTEFTPEGKPVTDEDVLSKLVYPEAKLLTESLLIDKRIGQLAEGKNAWLKLERNGRIHGEVNTNGTPTSRCTHSKPNVAQVPSCRVPYGPDCRALFTATNGSFSLIGVDFASLELRCLAHFMAPYDGGNFTQKVVSGDAKVKTPIALGLKDWDDAKTLIYGVVYGAGDEKAGAIIGKGREEGRRLKALLFKTIPGLQRLRDDVCAASKRGYLIGLDGRHIPIRSEHSSLNALLQSAGALLSKIASVILDQRLTDMGFKYKVDWAQCGHIHDELQLEARNEIAETVGQEAVKAFEEAGRHFKFSCPITGEYKIGRNWAETH